MDNQAWIRELVKEIGELETRIAKAAQYGEEEWQFGANMLKRLLRRRRYSLWCYQQSGTKGAH